MSLILLSLAKIAWIDILLSGDNAIVIALACAALPPRQRLTAMVAGTLLAVILRIAVTGAAAYMLALPYLQLSGGIALIVIAAKLLIDNEEDIGDLEKPKHIWPAIAAIIVADISMSIDNVIAVATASNGNVLLLAAGLVISIPIVIGGASIISTVINRFKILVWAGAALLGWIAGEAIVSDPVIAGHVLEQYATPEMWGCIGVALVLLIGQLWKNIINEQDSIVDALIILCGVGMLGTFICAAFNII